MSELYKILEELKTLGFVMNPPASQDQIDYLRNHLGFISDPLTQFEGILPKDIIELYRHHNGMPVQNKDLFDMRLMSIEEAAVAHSLLEWIENPPMSNDCRFFLAEDTSPAGGIYVTGKLSGKVIIWNTRYKVDYEGWILRFRSIESFYRHVLNFEHLVKQPKENPNQLFLLPKWQVSHTDYPQHAPSEYDDEDLYLAMEFIELAKTTEDELERGYYKRIAVDLMPFEEREQLIPFLTDNDSSIQEYAEHVFLGNVVALVQTNQADSEKKLLKLLRKLDSDNKSLLLSVLFQLGYEHKMIGKNRYAYRKSPKDKWTKI